METPIAIHWFRRDLRLDDNHALYRALRCGLPVMPIFIFDSTILDELSDKSDARVTFIYDTLKELDKQLQHYGSSLKIFYGKPSKIWEEITKEYSVKAVFFNRDYEPYALSRDTMIEIALRKKGIDVWHYKDQVIFEQNEITKDNGLPYTVYTPYSKKWRHTITEEHYQPFLCKQYYSQFLKVKIPFPNLDMIGFSRTSIALPPCTIDIAQIMRYHTTRDLPAVDDTTRLGIHLRFGTISIRSLVTIALQSNETFVKELQWREFFMQILWHFPYVVHNAFRPEYDAIQWRNNEEDFIAWTQGKTGYPLVDAGMRQLNATGFMHNRVRMVTASFLCKHLLIDWRKGEHYFAEKLLDFELSANNGNWQWAAGTGCDAAPYFRVFNPTMQQEKFDSDFRYCKHWVPEFGSTSYPAPIVEHTFARERALQTYKAALQSHI
ncbi:MAG TPA: deoxyribodipyrimidine photo-lyase [Candidatus Kapabacteria bacterium]|nr:deoxyribodipyrimidine photo-lyase [Candidatus Kapabacteria bacterium]